MITDGKELLYLVLAGGVVCLLLMVSFVLGKKIGSVLTEQRFSKRIDDERADAVKRSRAVLNGQFSEQFAAYLPDFPADPTEVRFIGKPVDFIAFCGASVDMIDEVIFIEVKTGNAALTKKEQSLRSAITNKRVRFVEYRISS
ncbi:MAG: Holliday junction resolvase-like protein [Treponema sp.]